MSDAPRPSVLALAARRATGVLMLACIGVFAAIVHAYGYEASERVVLLGAFGAKWNPSIDRGEYWRLISSAFLHAGIFHLALNMWALAYLGVFLEIVVGTGEFLLIYAVSALCGAWASYVGQPDLSVGASGAIFGVIGAFIPLAYLAPDRVPEASRSELGRTAVKIVVLNFLLGMGITRGSQWLGQDLVIDNYAHAGGLAGGLAVSTVLALLSRVRMLARPVAVVSFLLGFGVLAWGLAGALRQVPIGIRTVEIMQLNEQVVLPFIEAVRTREPVINELGRMNLNGAPPAADRAKAMREAVRAMLAARKAFAAGLAVPRARLDPEVHAAVADLRRELEPLDDLDARMAKLESLAAAAQGPALQADLREHHARWRTFFDNGNIYKSLNRIYVHLRKLLPMPDEEPGASE